MQHSLEVFVPRAAAGYDACIERVKASCTGQCLVSVSGPSPGALALATRMQTECGVRAQLQVDTSQTRESVEELLKGALAAGVCDVLLLLGGKRSSAPEGSFATLLELVEFVNGVGGLQIAVCGYPRGTKGELSHYSKDVKLLAQHVAAGASLILTAPVWDINHYVQYVQDARSAGVPASVPIEPSLLPLHALETRADLRRMAAHFEWTLPKALAAKVDALDEEDVSGYKRLGASMFVDSFKELKDRCKAARPHVLTMNSYAAIEALASVGAVPPPPPRPVEAPAPVPVTPATVEAVGPARLSIAPDAPVHILHSGKLALELGQILHTKLTELGLTPSLTCTEDFKRWAADVQLSDGSALPLLAVFIVETVEEAQPCEAAGPCTRFVHRRTNPEGMLRRLQYTVLGLGDSNLLLDRQTTSAKDCNQVAQKLDARIEELGGRSIYKRGEADDRTGNTEVDPWIAGLVDVLSAAKSV